MTAQEAIYKLKDQGVHIIKIEYSGGGDSGAIDQITYYDKNHDELNIIPDASLVDAIEKFAYVKLNDIEDWWNNEGGSGEMDINIDNLTYNINNEIRYTEHKSYNHNGNLSELLED